MDKKALLKLIREGIESVMGDAQKSLDKYKGQKISEIYDVALYEDEPFISFNVEGDVFPDIPLDETHRIFDFNEDMFSSWIEDTKDVSEYMEKDSDYDPLTKDSTMFSYFDYNKWKDYNNPNDYAKEFLYSEFRKSGTIPSPEFRA